MKKLVLAGLFLLASQLGATEYFTGPFNTWLNVVSQYGADPTGASDSTTAIQAAINAVTGSNCTVYVPAGNYKAGALTWQSQQIGAFIGAGSGSTTITWDGANGGTMFQFIASENWRIGRIHWDGNSGGVSGVGAAVGIGTECISENCGTSGGHGPTFLQVFDSIFSNMGKGFAGSENQSPLNSEIEIIRNTFNSCWTTGISLESYNAKDYWCWQNTFNNCEDGISNNAESGDAYAYYNYFNTTTNADIDWYSPDDWISAWGNVSINSNRFMKVQGSASSIPVIAINNRVVNTTQGAALFFQNIGPDFVEGNQIQSASGNTGVAVEQLAPTGYNASPTPTPNIGGGDLVSIDNEYTVATPATIINTTLAPGQVNRFWSQEDTQISPTVIVNWTPTPVFTPVVEDSNIIEVVAGSSAASIQGAINNASVSGPNFIVHLQPGTYNASGPVTIPTNWQNFLVGDPGYATVWSYTGSWTGYLLNIDGPSQPDIRDIFFNGNNSTINCIHVNNADQVGAFVWADMWRTESSTVGDYQGVSLVNCQVEVHSYTPSGLSPASTTITGPGTSGPAFTKFVGTGASQEAVTGCLATATNLATVLFWDFYTEGSGPAVFQEPANAAATISVIGSSLASTAAPISLTSYSGLFTSIASTTHGTGSIVDPSSSTNFWFYGEESSGATFTNTNPSQSGATVYYDGGKAGNQQVPNQGVTDPLSTTAIDYFLGPLRANPPNPNIPPQVANITGVYLHNIITQNGFGLEVSSDGSANTATPTPTATNTPTNTPTPTPTATFTPTATATPKPILTPVNYSPFPDFLYH